MGINAQRSHARGLAHQHPGEREAANFGLERGESRQEVEEPPRTATRGVELIEQEQLVLKN